MPRLRGFNHWFALTTPSRLACRTRAVWQYRPAPSLSGLLPPTPCASKARLPPASATRCDGPQSDISTHSIIDASWRTPRSKRTRASRRGGHLLTRPRRPSSNNGLPDHVCFRMPPSRTVAPYSPAPAPQALRQVFRNGRHLPSFIPVTNAIEALNRQLRKAIKTKGNFPNEEAARKLIYLAITNAVRRGPEPETGRQPCSRSRSTSETAYPTEPPTQKVGRPPQACPTGS
jgi:hypothetical protein